MLRWLSGRLSLQNFRRDLQLAQDTLGVHEARKACDFLLRHIYAVKAADRLGPTAEQEVLENIRVSALSSLPVGWFKRPGREMIAAALLDDWVTAKRGVLAGSLDQNVFQYIDNELWEFAKGRLQPQEIERLQIGATESQLWRSASSERNQAARGRARIISGTSHLTAEARPQPSRITGKSEEADLG